MVHLRDLQPGGPFRMTIAGTNTIRERRKGQAGLQKALEHEHAANVACGEAAHRIRPEDSGLEELVDPRLVDACPFRDWQLGLDIRRVT